jgi:hypothetical protein
MAEAISQETFVADDFHFLQRTTNAAGKKIHTGADEGWGVFPAKKKRRDCQIQLINKPLL